MQYYGFIYRGYYMAARRYEISLQVLKNISLVCCAHSWNIFQHEKRNFVSPSGHVMFYLLYKHQWNAKPFHFNIIFAVQGAMYHVAIATMIFSRVKITCYFHMWRYNFFALKLTWYFIGVYIINRGYYMAARRYEISLRVLKNISRVSAANEWNIFQHSKRNFVSPSGHVMFYLLYKHQWNAKPFHFNIFFAAKAWCIM